MRLSIIVILALAAVPAGADFVVVSKAHEVALTDLRLPGSTVGTLSFKACDTCDYRTVRVTAATEYEANGRLYELADFRKQLETVPDPAEETVTVLHHLESDTIKAVRVRF